MPGLEPTESMAEVLDSIAVYYFKASRQTGVARPVLAIVFPVLVGGKPRDVYKRGVPEGGLPGRGKAHVFLNFIHIFINKIGAHTLAAPI